VCPVPGHPCLDQIDPAAVAEAVATLSGNGAQGGRPGTAPPSAPRHAEVRA